MSGYRRFIAYVYEYQKGKKSGNCGFIKVEIRNQQCRIETHLHCPGLPPQTECKVYGIVRRDGLMNGILLGICETETDTAECLIETDAMNMAGSGISFGKMGAMILMTQTGGFFGTEWDDQPIRPDNFREMRMPAPEIEPEAAAKTAAEPRANTSTELQQETAAKLQQEASTDTAAELQADTSTELQQEASTELQQEAAAELQTETSTAPQPEAATELQQEAAAEIELQPELPTEPESPISTSSETPSISADLTPQDDPLPQEIESLPDAPAESVTSSDLKKQDAASAVTEFAPFDDLEFIKCWRIQPADLARISPRARALRSNRFLQYGYYNFGHLLLAQRSGGRYILGVPGGYDQQERFMAGMFGFPYFKECRHIELPGNRGGYWYRLIDAPNFN